MAVESADLRRRQRAGGSVRGQPGPPQHLVGDQVAHAGQPRWSISRALSAAFDPAERRGQLGGVTSAASGPSADSSGSSSTPPSSRGIADHQRAAVGEADGEPVPRRLVAPRGVDEPLDAGPPSTSRRAGHPEAQAQGRAARRTSSRSSLPMRRAAGRTATHQGTGTERRRSAPPLRNQAVGSRHRGDRSAREPPRPAAGRPRLRAARARPTVPNRPGAPHRLRGPR